MRDLRGVLGGVIDPHAAAMIGRGMKTLALRVARQNATALAAATALEVHPAVERVFYPLLPSHPDHAVAQAELRGGGGVVSFVVKGGRAAARRVVDGFRLARIAPSLGGVETLVEQPALMSFHEARRQRARGGGDRRGADPARGGGGGDRGGGRGCAASARGRVELVQQAAARPESSVDLGQRAEARLPRPP